MHPPPKKKNKELSKAYTENTRKQHWAFKQITESVPFIWAQAKGGHLLLFLWIGVRIPGHSLA
jgi:hypothetical protein